MYFELVYCKSYLLFNVIWRQTTVLTWRINATRFFFSGYASLGFENFIDNFTGWNLQNNIKKESFIPRINGTIFVFKHFDPWWFCPFWSSFVLSSKFRIYWIFSCNIPSQFQLGFWSRCFLPLALPKILQICYFNYLDTHSAFRFRWPSSSRFMNFRLNILQTRHFDNLDAYNVYGILLFILLTITWKFQLHTHRGYWYIVDLNAYSLYGLYVSCGCISLLKAWMHLVS